MFVCLFVCWLVGLFVRSLVCLSVIKILKIIIVILLILILNFIFEPLENTKGVSKNR